MSDLPPVRDTRFPLSKLVFANNYSASLLVSISGADQTLILNNPNFPPYSAGWSTDRWCALTLLGSDGSALEVVYSDNWRIDTANRQVYIYAVRGREGTAAGSFAAGTKIEMRLTAGLVNDILGGFLSRAKRNEANYWPATQTFAGGADIAGLTVMSNAAASFSGSAVMSSITVNASINFAAGMSCQQNITVSGGDGGGKVHIGTRAGNWSVIKFRLKDGNSRAGGLQWESPNAKTVQFGHYDEGGVFFWKDGVGDYFVIHSDGNFYCPRTAQIFGGSGGGLDIIKAYIDNQDANNRGLRTGGQWTMDISGSDGWRDSTWSGGGQYWCGVTTVSDKKGFGIPTQDRLLCRCVIRQMQVLIGGNWVNVWGY